MPIVTLETTKTNTTWYDLLVKDVCMHTTCTYLEKMSNNNKTNSPSHEPWYILLPSVRNKLLSEYSLLLISQYQCSHLACVYILIAVPTVYLRFNGNHHGGDKSINNIRDVSENRLFVHHTSVIGQSWDFGKFSSIF